MDQRRHDPDERGRRRPLIGVTGPDEGGRVAWGFIWLAIRRAGGTPRRITPSRPLPASSLDGLVLGGGADVQVEQRWPDGAAAFESVPAALPEDSRTRRLAGLALAPVVYGMRRLMGRSPDRSDQRRDRLELDLLLEAAELDLPVVGICRGAHIMNVHAGGTLRPDLSGYYEEDPRPWAALPCEQVDVAPGSRLLEALGRDHCRVNEVPGNAIDRLGAELQAVAHGPRGTVQAIENPSRRLWVGVQWHPEYLPQEPCQRRLFTALVAAAQRRAAEREGDGPVAAPIEPEVFHAVGASHRGVTWLHRRRH